MTSPLTIKAIDVINQLDGAEALNDAVFMAAHAINDPTHQAAILGVCDEVSRKLVAAMKCAKELRAMMGEPLCPTLAIGDEINDLQKRFDALKAKLEGTP
jgi:hypothetical protein